MSAPKDTASELSKAGDENDAKRQRTDDDGAEEEAPAEEAPADESAAEESAAEEEALAEPGPNASLVDFLLLCGKLKTTRRDVWAKGVKLPESLADRSWRMALTTLLLQDTDAGVDVGKCVMMAIVHDLAGATVDEEKPKMMEVVRDSILKDNPAGQRIYDLWAEYEAGESAEAKAVKEMGAIETATQSLEHQQSENIDLSEYQQAEDANITSPLGRDIVAELSRQRSALPSGGGVISGAARSDGGVTFRALWPLDKLEALVAEIPEMERGTGAKIEPATPVEGCDEVVIHVASPDVPGVEMISAMAGLQALLQLLFADAIRHDPASGQQPPPYPTGRYLVEKLQIGAVLGKGGSVISAIRMQTGAQIRVHDADQLPSCGTAGSDELLTVAGDHRVVGAAVRGISLQLRQFQASGAPSNPMLVAGMHGGGGGMGGPPMGPPAHLHHPAVHGAPPGNMGVLQQMHAPRQQMQAPVQAPAPQTAPHVERLTVDNSHVGSILGKGGSNINQIRSASGAHVKIHEADPGQTVRLIEITGPPDRVEIAKTMIQAFMAGDATGAAAAYQATAAAAPGAAQYYVQPAPQQQQQQQQQPYTPEQQQAAWAQYYAAQGHPQ